MASTYTPLGIELQATGENAGTWGTKTNTNLSIIEQISGGYSAQSIAGGEQTTALSVSDGATGAVMSHRMIEFTGSITGNQIVTIPNDAQNFYFLRNSTSGAYTVQFKYATGSGDSFTFSATDKGDKIVFPQANSPYNPKAYLQKVLTTIMDNAKLDYKIVDVEVGDDLGRTAEKPKKEEVAKQKQLYIFTDPDGKEIITDNLSKFCRENKLNKSTVYLVMNGKRNHHKHFKCRKVED